MLLSQGFAHDSGALCPYVWRMTMVLTLLRSLLMASLLLTSVSAGMARGQAAPVGVIELCRGLTTLSVQVDADGTPVTHVHLCPDGVMTLVGEVPVGAAVPVVDAALLPLAYNLSVARCGPQACPVGVARGPPASS